MVKVGKKYTLCVLFRIGKRINSYIIDLPLQWPSGSFKTLVITIRIMVSQAPFYRHLFLPQTQLPKVGISLSDQTVDLNIRPLTLWLYLL